MNPEAITEQALWPLIQQGDLSAFDRLYHLHVQVIFSTIYKHIRNRCDAEDLTQEVFTDLWANRAAIIIERSLFNYLYSIARYKTLRYLSQKVMKPESLELFSEAMAATGWLAAPVEGYAATKILAAESAVAREIAQLPAQMKKVYELNTDGGMSIAEIAHALVLSPYTVKNHLAKVRKRLRLTASRFTSLFFNILPSLLLLTMLPNY